VKPRASAAPAPKWATNGSFVVIRRLNQDVAAFWKFLEQTALSLAAKPAFAGMTADRLGALLVGRWPSGAPIMRATDNDDPALASNDVASNQFRFAASAPLARLMNEPPPIDPFPAAPSDQEGFRCPYGAHIRKVNPRDDITEQGGGNRTLLRRILRRGIPFGPPLSSARTVDDGVERGLMFVSYQADIASQFEFLSTDWINSTVNPRAYDTHQAGPDPLIGQITDDQGQRTRRMAVPGRDGVLEEIVLPAAFVAATGGAYLFSPSLSALHDVLS
jgi:Dyp-type peroxidase family